MKRIFTLLTILLIFSATILNAGQQPPEGDAQGNQPATPADQGQEKKEDNAPKKIPADPSSLQRELYREIKLNTDYTLKFVNKLEQTKINEAASFVVVTYSAPEKIKSVAAYGRDKKLTLYVLDNTLNMFFYYVTYDIADGLVKSYILRDPSDQKLWQVKFEYDNGKNIVKNEIWKRETVTGELKLLFYNTYQYYNQGKMFLHSRYDKNKELEEKTYYTPEGAKKRYERYRGNGKLQYYIVYFYQNGKETKREVYSESDVLLEIINTGPGQTAMQNQPAQR